MCAPVHARESVCVCVCGGGGGGLCLVVITKEISTGRRVFSRGAMKLFCIVCNHRPKDHSGTEADS